MFKKMPKTCPCTPLLNSINDPSDLRKLKEEQLPLLAEELRHFLLFTVGQTGGHFGAGLGVVELTIALHYVLDTPKDCLVWDVGHQSYPHKILTGRRELMQTLRQRGGLSPFPKRAESVFDSFGVGHSSTSVSAVLGMAMAARIHAEKKRCVAVIGDGALTAGQAYEALNHAAHERANVLVVLNDNDMSISKNVGGMANYLARLLTSRTYQQMRNSSKKLLANLPLAKELVRKTEEHVKGMVSPSTLFEELGFNYIGPIDGHDIKLLTSALRNVAELEGPQFLHIVTVKGKGFEPAEADPIGYHAITKLEPRQEKQPTKKQKFSNVFGQWICDMAEKDRQLVAITPAMKEGSDLIAFAERFPKRYFDVAICEQHAITLAAGMACGGLKPVVAIYSTFLQRGYDQLIHDVAVQNLNILLAVDRAGIVGEDGPTHAGCFDIAFLRCIPNLIIMTPSDEAELRSLLSTGFYYEGPAVVRYPRGYGSGVCIDNTFGGLSVGVGRVVRRGKKVALLVFGALVETGLCVAEEIEATVVDMRFVKPLDQALLSELSKQHRLFVTLEEGALMGGAGSAVSEYVHKENLPVSVLTLGIKDSIVEHGNREELLSCYGLDKMAILRAIKART